MAQFYTVRQLSEFLNISTRYIYLLVQQEKIPRYKIGKCLRFNPIEIDGWLKQRHFWPKENS